MAARRLVTILAISSISFGLACSDDDAKSDGPSQLDGGADITVVNDGVAPDGETPDGSTGDTTQSDGEPQSDTQIADLPQGPSAKIHEARVAPDGTVNILIEGVYVTYVTQKRGDDVAGFFIQYEQLGPALFIAVDAATLTPTPAAGDLVSLTVTEMATDQGRRQASAISGLSVASSNNALDGLKQNVTNASDLISALDSYDAELITLDGTITADFAPAGTGFVSAAIDTGALTGETNIKLRLPQGLQQTLGISNGCTFSLSGTPLWRYNSQAQPSAWAEADITVNSCPAPKVVSAIATSATTVRVVFDSPIEPTSVNANGDQFTFDNSLTASAATVTGSEVLVTTSSQTEGTTYTVTVATSVTDTRAAALDATANTATFTGYQLGAKLRINELNADILNGCDLLEIRVIEAGSLNGYKLVYRSEVVLYFPPNMTVAKNDYIVVHFDADDETFCYANGVPDEIGSNDKNMQPSVANTIPNFDGAWDLYSTKEGIAYTSSVISITDPSDAIVDAVFYSESTNTGAAASTLDAADVVAAANEWTPVGAAARTSYDATTFVEDAAKYTRNPSGSRDYDKKSLQRGGDTDTNTKDDWTDASATPTWGANNPGQSNL